MNTEQYFKHIEEETRKIYDIASKARARGLDPVEKVEIPLSRSLAEKVVGLITVFYPQIENSGIVERILNLEKDYGKLDPMVSFKIAEEVAKQKFCKFSSLLEAVEAGVRIGFAYTTLGVVSSPIEGFTGITLEKTKEGKDYFVGHFSGPIRSAGTTASCLVLMLIDYLREMFGYAKYDPDEDEIQRYVTENQDYHERVTNLQYMPTKDEIVFLAKNLPIQIDGDPTEKMEVSNYKNLPRVHTNNIRGGMCLIFSEGLAQKAAKGLRLLNSMKDRGLKSTGFDFLEEYIKLHEQRDKGKTDDSPTYINDLVAGRPVFGHPSESGAFRFRYGRGRSSGFSAVSVHPATMEMTDSFIAIGTQLKIEKPTKGCIVTSCDTIEGPIVKLFNGSVKKVKTREEAKKLYPDTEEIIYIGDLLFPLSDVVNRNAKLLRPGYVEEIWALELAEKMSQTPKDLEKSIDKFNVNFENAVKVSKEQGISLHPNYIFYWTQISKKQFLNLIDWLAAAKVDKKIILPYFRSDQEKFREGKRALELLGVEHEVSLENVIMNLMDSKILFSNLGIDVGLLEKEGFVKEDVLKVKDKLESILEERSEEEDKEGAIILEAINQTSEFEIRDKSGDFIGARMGRPEKAKLRKLTGSPNVLFPVGSEGGRLRSVQAACETGGVRGDFPLFYCEECKKETIYPHCETCGKKSKKMFYCPECGKIGFNPCKEHESGEVEGNAKSHSYKTIDMNYYFQNAIEKLGLTKNEIPPLVKGVRGTSSVNHMVESLSKGILRSLFDLQVNKDGTIRFDATEMPLVSFKPSEISVSVEKLKELGYTEDMYGNELKDDNQILELKPHDILLPCSPESPDGGADKVFMKICNFVDELLVRFYGMKKIYNISKKEDLVGELGVFMAPHNCAGVVCRIIGFSDTLGLFASPYMHAAVRRDCDGDEAAVMLLGDVLLNFSKEFLAGHRGGTQDAPLVLNAKINAGEVDDQILDFELIGESGNYPLELYKLAEKREHSSVVEFYDVHKALKEGKDPFVGIGFTHDTSDINKGVSCSNYKILATMQDKVHHQMELVEKIRAANTSETARLVIERHFLKDLRGNLRKFSMQEFRCVACNETMRRPPLSGVCTKCGGKIIFTTHEGGIKKYLEPALELVEKYHLSNYIKQSLELTRRQIDSVFGKELEKQEALEKWF